jgi:hypothetical protein
MQFEIKENKNTKLLRSSFHNYNFDKKTGAFMRWGEKFDVDPSYGLPEIADIEITDICEGVTGLDGVRRPCKFCYKSNSPSNTKNMSFDTFKEIFDKHIKKSSICQIAFGVDSQCKSNPDVWKIFQYCRENDVIPNVTVADIDPETAAKLACVVGGIAVSRYENKNVCYDSVKLLIYNEIKQVNIHIMSSEETFEMVKETFRDYLEDPRLKGLNAIVLLSLKQKGRGTKYTPLSKEKFGELVKIALDKDIPIGFDSCSCGKFLKEVGDHPQYEQFKMLSEPCESTCFSLYINVEGKFFPCSFTENTKEFGEGIDVLTCNNFITDIWFHPKTVEFRNKLLANNRSCPLYNI